MIHSSRKGLLPLMLFALMNATACAQQRAQPIVDYETARPIFWRQIYGSGGESLYCGQQFGSGYNKQLNIEHVYPMSWVTYSLGCGKRQQCRRNSDEFNLIEADLHNLYPSRSDINYERGSRAFANIAGEHRRFGECDFETAESPRQVEPRPAARGEIARAMFYMADRYDLSIRSRQLELLKKWNKADQPSNEEERRNDVIEGIQGNRNPFIDNPGLVDKTRFVNN